MAGDDRHQPTDKIQNGSYETGSGFNLGFVTDRTKTPETQMMFPGVAVQ